MRKKHQLGEGLNSRPRVLHEGEWGGRKDNGCAGLAEGARGLLVVHDQRAQSRLVGVQLTKAHTEKDGQGALLVGDAVDEGGHRRMVDAHEVPEVVHDVVVFHDVAEKEV